MTCSIWFIRVRWFMPHFVCSSCAGSGYLPSRQKMIIVPGSCSCTEKDVPRRFPYYCSHADAALAQISSSRKRVDRKYLFPMLRHSTWGLPRSIGRRPVIVRAPISSVPFSRRYANVMERLRTPSVKPGGQVPNLCAPSASPPSWMRDDS